MSREEPLVSGSGAGTTAWCSPPHRGRTTTVVCGPEQWYLLQLRVLGAWWRLGSSTLAPHLLLQYSLTHPAAWREVA
jgi:hypothetical protein